MEDAIKTPDTGPMAARGTELVAQARATKITNDEELQRAGSQLRLVKELVREIEDSFGPPKKAAHETHKRITELEKKLLADPKQAEFILKKVIGDWQVAETKRIREQERLAAEAARKAQEEQQLAEAEQLEAEGQPELAEEVVSRPVVAPAVSIPRPKVAGVSTRPKHSFKIVDVDKIDRRFMIPNETAIRKLFESMGKDAEKVVGVGGVEYVLETVTSVR